MLDWDVSAFKLARHHVKSSCVSGRSCFLRMTRWQLSGATTRLLEKLKEVAMRVFFKGIALVSARRLSAHVDDGGGRYLRT